jgi:hypothetical protein
VRGEAHEPPLQSPPEHVCPAPQAVVQEPQCIASVVGSMQLPPHASIGAMHEHVPAAQPTPVGHALSHVPQFASSPLTFVQTPWHIMLGAAHVSPSMVVPVSRGGPLSDVGRSRLEGQAVRRRPTDTRKARRVMSSWYRRRAASARGVPPRESAEAPPFNRPSDASACSDPG